MPVLGCIADDVTGATDLAINLLQGGMRVVQILGIPDQETMSNLDDVDAIVVALKTRSVPKETAIEQSVQAARALQNDCRIERFYFKYCSTFDSTEEGNIGPVAEALMQHLDTPQTVFCPAFPRAGRTVYRGHLFVGDALLNESGMEKHPLNPMTDANLVRFLSKQSTKQVGLFRHDMFALSRESNESKFKELENAGFAMVVTDACNDSQLNSLAQVVATMPLITGGSGLARYLPSAYRTHQIWNEDAYEPQLPQVEGRALVVAGSCSATTNRQVAEMKAKHPAMSVDVPALMESVEAEQKKVVDWAKSTEGNAPLLIYSTNSPAEVKRLQNQFGAQKVACAIEDFFAMVTRTLVVELKVRKLILAGGETSGAIVQALGIRSLAIGPEIAPGVPWTESIGTDPTLALALKSGNFGADDFFESALEMLT